MIALNYENTHHFTIHVGNVALILWRSGELALDLKAVTVYESDRGGLSIFNGK